MCGPAPEHRLRRRRRESPAVGEPSPVTPQTQEWRGGVSTYLEPPQSRYSAMLPDLFDFIDRSGRGLRQGRRRPHRRSAGRHRPRGDRHVVSGDPQHPRRSAAGSGARGARPSSRPEDRAMARATRSRCSCVVSATGETVAAVATRGRHDRSRGRRRDPGDDARGRDGAQRGDRSRHGAPCRRLAARRRAPGPDAVLGLAAVPTTTDDGQPTMAQRVVGATRAATTRPWPRRRHHDINAL